MFLFVRQKKKKKVASLLIRDFFLSIITLTKDNEHWKFQEYNNKKTVSSMLKYLTCLCFLTIMFVPYGCCKNKIKTLFIIYIELI
jgi:hypothetical protein